MSNVVKFPQAYMSATDALRRVAADVDAEFIKPTRVVILFEEDDGEGRVRNRMAVGGTDSLKDVAWILRVASERLSDMTKGG